MNLFDAHSIVGDLGLIGILTIIFAETGLLVGLAFPGDSLLFIVGILLATGLISTPVWLALVAMSVSAILGNLLGYWTGAKLGPKLFNKPDSRIFKQEYVVITQNFFEKHGPRAIVLARFVPVVRPVITSMAGVARMNFRVYATYSTIGGILWVVTLTLAGYFFGGIQFVADNIELVTLGIVGLSLIPVVLEVLKQRRARS